DKNVIADAFIKKIDEAVQVVKSNQKARKEFMTYQMALLESKMDGEERGRAEERNSIALNMIRKGLSLEDIHEITTLSIEKIKELAKNKISAEKTTS
ncbi:MAG: hypothetical protein IK062_03015, partial [Selenomonadaceae bacterium]|nr:hypothetical protein [Selenomonadaceae bacterium]